VAGPASRHRFVDIRGDVTQRRLDVDNWLAPDWKGEERQREEARERAASRTPLRGRWTALETPAPRGAAPEPATPGFTPPAEPLAENVLHGGAVRHWYPAKQSGFVNADSRGRRYQIWFGASAVEFDHALLEPGLRVRFNVAPDPRGEGRLKVTRGEGRLKVTRLLLE
jgi:hypothetical protein